VGNEISLSGADSVLRSALDGLALRHQAIAANVANVDTPGYKANVVSFESQLRQALDTRQPGRLAVTDPGHIGWRPEQPITAEVTTTDASTLRNDGNNVDIDREMILLADTSLKYSTATRLVSDRLALLRTVINEGRR
jgi:flagellar basal-body rod protein FlgB